jgi:hypothetical protein
VLDAHVFVQSAYVFVQDGDVYAHRSCVYEMPCLIRTAAQKVRQRKELRYDT